MRPWTAKQSQGHSFSLMAATQPFPLTSRSPSQSTFRHTARVLPPANPPRFPHYYSQTLNGQAYRRLFGTEVLEERPLSTAFWTSLSGRQPVIDLSAWTKLYSASQLAGQNELLIWLGQSGQWFSDTMTTECKAVYSVQSLFYSPTPNKLYRIS